MSGPGQVTAGDAGDLSRNMQHAALQQAYVTHITLETNIIRIDWPVSYDLFLPQSKSKKYNVCMKYHILHF